MSLHDLPSPRKHRRLGLYLPFAVLVLAILGWTAFWIHARGETQKRMDAAVAQLKTAGYDVTWGERHIGGYPFRINVTLTDARVREVSGWALASPKVEAQSYLHALGKWMLAAPQGLTFVRPLGGPVEVTGELVRASLRGLDKHPPSFSFEGVKLAFQPAAGAQPFGLASAERVEFHLRPGPDDEGGVFVRVDNGKARAGTLFGRIAADRPVAIQWESTTSKMSAFKGQDWRSAVRAWTDAGGVMNVRRAGLTLGDAVMGANAGTLSVGSDGRLTGMLDVTLRQAPLALQVLGETGVIPPERIEAAAAVIGARQGAGDTARATLNFQAGQTTLGPVAIGPAPKVHQWP